MSSAITINTNTSGEIKIQTRWNGSNLAVHRFVIKKDEGVGLSTKEDDLRYKWTVTHKPTGFSAGKFNNLKKAIQIAREWDHCFHHQTKDEVKSDTVFCNAWTKAVRDFDGSLP